MRIPETDGGVYQVVVTTNGICAEPPIGEYSIAVNQASDPSLTLLQDDYAVVVSSTVFTSVGEGTVTLP